MLPLLCPLHLVQLHVDLRLGNFYINEFASCWIKISIRARLVFNEKQLASCYCQIDKTALQTVAIWQTFQSAKTVDSESKEKFYSHDCANS
jgi:hypothetical protein